MGSIRALALCVIVAVAFASCVVAESDWQTVTSFVSEGESQAPEGVTDEVPRAHTTTALYEDPFAIEAGLPIAQEDPELEQAWADVENKAQLGSIRVGAAAAASPCTTQGGVCQVNTQTCNGGKYYSSLCVGAANIQCCKKLSTKTEGYAKPADNKPAASNEPDSPCKTRGGSCKEGSAGCSGTFAGGLCPGAASVKCCLSTAQYTAFTKEAVAPCGPYAGKAGSPTQGNGGRWYNAVAIVKEHMTNPEKFGWSIKEADNTLETKTACAFAKMHNDAKKAGVTILIASGFRTLTRQQYFYDCMNCGCCNNGNLAAVPGSSNHGIGLAMDINASDYGVYDWMAKNGASYGFVRTVPSEDWHWEYRVGWSRTPYT